MKKVDTNNGVWVNDDPATLTNGTPIDADVMNNIQDEISNVIIENGETLDGTNHSQLSQTLNKNFAKLNSPTLTGIPLTSNPDGTVDNQIATVDYVNQKALQATVGFTPVQQSGGDNQGANKVYVGADKTDASQVRIQIDQTDLGKIVFQEENNDTYGIKQIGYNHTSDFISTLDSNNNYHNIHTADYIDAKQWISSLPDGNNLKVSDIIWNSSSSLPALYYGTVNSVAYLATETWANTTFQPVGNYATINQVQTFTADQTIQSSNLHIVNGSLLLANPSGDDVAIYTDIEGKGVSKNDLVVRTNSGSSSVYTTISNNGDLVSSVHGKAAFENRQNTFNGGQTVIEQSGTALLLTAPGSLTALEFGIDGDDGLSFIDFHCQKDGGAYTDYDARIIASGGSSGAIGAATLDFEAANVTWQGYSLTRISDFSFNKNTNGYIILPTGFIIQWGKVNPSGGTYNFPIAFPNAVFNIVSGNSDYQGQYADTAYAWAVSTSQFRAGTKAVNTGWATTFEVSWVAFGF